MPTNHDFVNLALTQAGDRYVFGAEAAKDDPNPTAFDCSELIEWTCGRLNVKPTMPDGSWIQARHCQNHKTLISVSKALATRGALLFRFSTTPFSGSRPSSSHVVISLGDNRTMEARSTASGVGVFGNASARGWTHAGLVPGVSYVASGLPSDHFYTVDVKRPTVRKGDSDGGGYGGPVMVCQALLVAHSYWAGKKELRGENLSGVFDSQTDQLVRAYQKNHGLTVDGIVGPKTWGSLETVG